MLELRSKAFTSFQCCLDIEFKILLVGEIYWKDKYTHLCKFLVDMQASIHETMVGTPSNNFYMDNILQMCNKPSIESEIEYEIRRVFPPVVLFFETLEPH